MAYAIYFFLLQIMNYKISTIILAIVSLALLVSTVYYANNTQVKYETMTQNDTIIIKSIDTITVTKKDIEYRDVIVLDTVFVRDTSLVVEQKRYEDSISTIFISGVNPELDSIEYRIPRDTIQIEIEKIQTVKEQESFWHNRFTISAGVFAGYGLITHKPDVFIGVGCAVRLY